jgi:hypothetical protein
MLVVTGLMGESLMLAGLNTVSREKTLTLPKESALAICSRPNSTIRSSTPSRWRKSAKLARK